LIIEQETITRTAVAEIVGELPPPSVSFRDVWDTMRLVYVAVDEQTNTSVSSSDVLVT
jgi:hypothetical protein